MQEVKEREEKEKMELDVQVAEIAPPRPSSAMQEWKEILDREIFAEEE